MYTCYCCFLFLLFPVCYYVLDIFHLCVFPYKSTIKRYWDSNTKKKSLHGTISFGLVFFFRKCGNRSKRKSSSHSLFFHKPSSYFYHPLEIPACLSVCLFFALADQVKYEVSSLHHFTL